MTENSSHSAFFSYSQHEAHQVDDVSQGLRPTYMGDQWLSKMFVFEGGNSMLTVNEVYVFVRSVSFLMGRMPTPLPPWFLRHWLWVNDRMYD